MNHNLTTAVKQSITATRNENPSHDLRQAIKVINVEYQRIEWEDQEFLNRVLTTALENIEKKEARL